MSTWDDAIEALRGLEAVAESPTAGYLAGLRAAQTELKRRQFWTRVHEGAAHVATWPAHKRMDTPEACGFRSSPPRVLIESPFAGDRTRNGEYLRAAMRDSLRRGEAPFASHLVYPLVLDDNVPEERRQGMEAGFAWGAVAECVAVYRDLGISEGMAEGIDRAHRALIPVEYRSIAEWSS